MFGIADILQATAWRSEEVEELAALSRNGKLSCEMIRIVEDERPHRQPRSMERAVFVCGSGIIIRGDVPEQIILHHVYEIVSDIVWAVLSFEPLEGFLFLPCRYDFLQRAYYQQEVLDRRFNNKVYKEITLFKRMIALQFFDKIVDIRDPHLVIDWKKLPSLVSMIKQLYPDI